MKTFAGSKMANKLSSSVWGHEIQHFCRRSDAIKRLVLYVAAASMLLLNACSSRGSFPHNSGTTVDLSRKNYRIVKPNAIGTSSGFRLLGIIPLAAPSYTSAMSDLYDNARIREGSATALVNISEEESGIYLILFSIPKLTVRADIIEFTDSRERTSSNPRTEKKSSTYREETAPREVQPQEVHPEGRLSEETSGPTQDEEDANPYDRY